MPEIHEIDRLKALVGEVAAEYGVKKVALFGSYSDGTACCDSDVDLLIDKGDIKGLFRFNAFIRTLEEKLEKPVDVLTYASLDKSLIKEHISSEVLLYER